MNINISKDVLSHLNCMKIELESKPTLMARSLNKKETLVLVVDMVNGFAKKGALASPRVAAIIPDIRAALELLPNADKAFLNDMHTETSVELKFFPPHCMGDKHKDEECKRVSELSAIPGWDIAKDSTNGFFNLTKYVPLDGYTNILIMGCCTDICILQLALTLRSYLNETNNPLPVSVFVDYVETYDSPLHNADLNNLFALKTMEGAGVQLFKKLV